MEEITVIVEQEITEVTVIVQEGVGGGGNDKNFEHTQTTPSAVWNIAHNLNKKPSVTVVDSAGSLLIGDLTYNDNNSLSINFGGVEITGIATLN